MALVRGLRPPHDTTNDASFLFTTTRQLLIPPVCSREPLKGTCSAREIRRVMHHHGELVQQSTAPSSAVGAPSLNPYLSPYTIIVPNFTHYSVCNNSKQYYVQSSILFCKYVHSVRRPTSDIRPGQPNVVGGEASIAKHAPFMCTLVYHRSYIYLCIWYYQYLVLRYGHRQLQQQYECTTVYT